MMHTNPKVQPRLTLLQPLPWWTSGECQLATVSLPLFSLKHGGRGVKPQDPLVLELFKS